MSTLRTLLLILLGGVLGTGVAMLLTVTLISPNFEAPTSTMLAGFSGFVFASVGICLAVLIGDEI